MYVDGKFDVTKANDMAAQTAMGKAFAADAELFRAFDSWRRLPENGGEAIKDTLLNAVDTLGLFKPINKAFDYVTGSDTLNSLVQSAMEPYGFTETLDGNYTEPWRSDQAQEEAMGAVRSAAPVSDEDVEKERREAAIAEMEAQQAAEAQGAAGNIFNVEEDPQLGALRQRVGETKDNPFLFGADGNRSQIDNFLDIAGGKIPLPNRSDARSVAKFNDSFAGRQFTKDAGFRKARELSNLEGDRRQIVKNHNKAMMNWVANNPEHKMAEKGLSNWTDQDKISFVRNFNLGNLDDPAPDAPAPKGVPVFDEDGLMGFDNIKNFAEDMGGQRIRMNPDQPNSIQKRERKDKATLDDIRGEIRETGKHPFGEGPVLGTDHAREVELSKKYGGDMAGLKKAARDVRDSPVAKANYAEAFLPADFNAPKAGAAQQGPSRPLNEGFTAGGVVDKFKSSTANLMNQESEATNSVLDNVPMPQMPRPTFPKPKPGPFHYTNKTKNYPVIENYPSDNGSGGVELTRTSPEVAVMPPVKYPSSNQPGMELTRTSPERLTMDEPTAQYRKQTPGYGRSGKKQYNIPGLDRLDPDNYDHRPNAPKHPGGAGMGRSGKKQYNIPGLEFLDPDNYFYNQ